MRVMMLDESTWITVIAHGISSMVDSLQINFFFAKGTEIVLALFEPFQDARFVKLIMLAFRQFESMTLRRTVDLPGIHLLLLVACSSFSPSFIFLFFGLRVHCGCALRRLILKSFQTDNAFTVFLLRLQLKIKSFIHEALNVSFKDPKKLFLRLLTLSSDIHLF